MNANSRRVLPTLDEGVRVLDRLIRNHLKQDEQNRMVLLIAGGSGAGKTTLCRRLETIGSDRVHVTADNYYVGATTMKTRGLKPYFFDDPKALDAELATTHVRALISGCPVQQPVYSFAKSERLRMGQEDVTRTIHPGRVILVDNLFAFYGGFDPWLTQEVPCHLRVARIFVDAFPNVRFTRRYERDTRERGKDHTVTTLLWTQHVQPMYEQHVRLQARQADFVLRNDHWLPSGYSEPLDPYSIDCTGCNLDHLSDGI